jgi:hypothetical protein
MRTHVRERHHQLVVNGVCHLLPAGGWPGYSPDINIIENVMGTVLRAVRSRRPSSMEELEQFLVEEWAKATTPEKLAPYYASLPGRMERIIDAKGGHIVEKGTSKMQVSP